MVGIIGQKYPPENFRGFCVEQAVSGFTGCNVIEYEDPPMPSDCELKIVPAGLDRRALISRDIAERTGIDDAMIDKLVRAFYGRTAQDPVLGPIFGAHIEDWEAHIAKLCDFWSSVALLTGRYHGAPMAAHMPMPLGSTEFDRWLAIFTETTKDVSARSRGPFCRARQPNRQKPGTWYRGEPRRDHRTPVLSGVQRSASDHPSCQRSFEGAGHHQSVGSNAI